MGEAYLMSIYPLWQQHRYKPSAVKSLANG